MSLLPERLRVQLGLEVEKPQTQLQELQEALSCSALTYEERLIGFGLCFGAGALLSLTSLFSFARLMRGYPRDFAVKYTLGNLIAICSTAFLVGPRKQVANMMHERRWLTVTVWCGAMVLTLTSALCVKEAGVTFICILVQFTAGVWYGLSYIPYGQGACIGGLKSAISRLTGYPTAAGAG
ncbi:hypothetical protein KFE25_008878 [Diacronema lutheri]|uniref:Vesicle transport protein n=2 Tax=Diacronema lutheri TaxID=2081491 RepID=A0A8J5XXC4_DIALT|nr:hypothetical protein KFE25_008878 [Diacronema lutheri]